MGRTIRTFREGIKIEEARWKGFRRTLRPSQREHFDHIFNSARSYADAGTMIVTPRIVEVILLSAILEMLGENDDIAKRVKSLEQRLEETTP